MKHIRNIGVVLLALFFFMSVQQVAYAYEPSSSEIEVYTYLNDLRVANGLSPLSFSCILGQSARAKSIDMDSNGYFSHQSPYTGSPEDLKVYYGYPANSPGWGENILWGASSGYEAYTIWLNSPPHLDNMLNGYYTEVGIGHTGGSVWGDGINYFGVYTMHFGNASTQACALPTNTVPSQVFDTATLASLNLRNAPSLSGAVIEVMPYGTGVDLLSDFTYADGYTWVYVNNGYNEGWTAAEYLDLVLPTTPAPAPDVSTGEVGYYYTADYLNLRTGPSLSYEVMTVLPIGLSVADYDGDVRYNDGYTWISVETTYGVGWVAAEYLI